MSPKPGRRTVLITGASAGIGAALARVCAADGWDLILTARREDRLLALADDIMGAHPIQARVIAVDLAQTDAVRTLVQTIDDQGLVVDGLINNAGFSRTTGFLQTDPADHAAMLRVMLGAPVELTRLLLPGMVQRDFGRVLNVASLAGLMPATGGDTLYGPIKSFLIKASQGLYLETRGAGVHVTVLNPGYTLTEFHDVNGSREQVSSAYPPWMWMDADRVARIGWAACETGKPSITPGFANRVLSGLARHLPEGLALKMVGGHARRLERI